MSTERKRLKCLWRWLAGILGVLVILAVGASLLFFVFARSAAKAWESLAAELRAAGEPLTFVEIQALRPQVPDDQNGARVIERAIAKLQAIEEPGTTDVFTLDPDCKTDFFKGVSAECIEPMRRYVEARRAALNELAKLREFPRARFEIPYERPMFEVTSTVLELNSGLRALGRLAYIDALLKIIDEDGAAASQAIALHLRLSQPLYEAPGLLPHLVAISIDTWSVRVLEGLLRTGELDEETVVDLQCEWEREAQSRTMKWALQGERASFIRTTDEKELQAIMDATRRQFPDISKTRWHMPNPVNWIPFKDDWYLLRNRLAGVTVLSRLVDASDDSAKLLSLAREREAWIPGIAPGHELIRIMLPSLTRPVELHVRTLAFFRCVPVALAAERYRLETGGFPESIDRLVPDYLTAIPNDPYDGNPIRLVRTQEGIAVYSVGENMIDDGGRVVAAEGQRFGQDFGLRLLSPGQRRLLILDKDEDDGH